MTVVNMRDHVKKEYVGDSWRKKVDQMTDAQVIAVYFRLQREGKDFRNVNKSKKIL